MIKQTFKFAIRSFRKSPFMTFINVLGLALGLTVFYLVSLYVYQENSYEKDFEYRDRMYQVSADFYGRKLGYASENLSYVLDEIPEIELFTTFSNAPTAKISVEGIEYTGLRQLTVDSSFFKVFDFELLQGDINTVLKEPNAIVMNERTALRLFHTTDVIGQVVSLYGDKVGVIRGISKTPHFKTQMDFDLVVSELRGPINQEKWQSASDYTYVVTNNSVSVKDLNSKLDELSIKYVYPTFFPGGAKNISVEEWRSERFYTNFFVESIDELRRESQTLSNMMPKVNNGQLKTLGIVGLVALLISIFNFINLSTAKASVRMKEVGVKRILGSSRSLLATQFLLESFLLILFSSVLALSLVEVLVKLKPDFLGMSVEYSSLHSTEWVGGLFLSILILTLISGIYPALYLSSGNIVSILKKGTSKNSFSVLNAVFLRKTVTVLQFVCSIGLITAVITMFLQIDHIRSRDRGYATDGAMVINSYFLKESKKAFKNELLRLPNVAAAGYTYRFSDNHTPGSSAIPVMGEDSIEVRLSPYYVDEDFFAATNMKIVEGNDFKGGRAMQLVEEKEEAEKKEKTGDTNNNEEFAGYSPAVINETAARLLGLKDPVGRVINERYEVVGVVNDFSFSDLRNGIEPAIFRKMSVITADAQIVVRLNSSKNETDAIKEVWSEFTDVDMGWFALGSQYAKNLEIETRGFKSVFVFSVFAIIISSLGLLGLAVFTVDQRIQEFGIRKVLGASVTDIMRLFGTSFAKLVAIAFLLAIPISIYTMQNWLDGFADRIHLSVGIFIITAIIILFIVATTILFQSLKAGRLNPVDTLRNE